ncbi:diphosphate--fructose-6-phosphate 1-phosphotransferase [Ranunculus cassubicifolius]
MQALCVAGAYRYVSYICVQDISKYPSVNTTPPPPSSFRESLSDDHFLVIKSRWEKVQAYLWFGLMPMGLIEGRATHIIGHLRESYYKGHKGSYNVGAACSFRKEHCTGNKRTYSDGGNTSCSTQDERARKASMVKELTFQNLKRQSLKLQQWIEQT